LIKEKKSHFVTEYRKTPSPADKEGPVREVQLYAAPSAPHGARMQVRCCAAISSSDETERPEAQAEVEFRKGNYQKRIKIIKSASKLSKSASKLSKALEDKPVSFFLSLVWITKASSLAWLLNL
jgi:hypothetical protein